MYHDAYNTTRNPIPVINKPKMRLSPSIRKEKFTPPNKLKFEGSNSMVCESKFLRVANNKTKTTSGTNESTHPNRCFNNGYKTIASIPEKNKIPINKGRYSLMLKILFNNRLYQITQK